MRRWLGMTMAFLGVLGATAAQGSEASKLLYSRGLVEFHAERYSQALELFNQAVTEDETDAYAHYYRAVTRSRLNDLDGAITDLQAALAAKPDLDQAALDLGAALVQKREYRAALPWLGQAQRVPDLDGEASQFMGLAYLRLGQLNDARRNFQRAATRDPKQTLGARYYQGVVEYQQGNWQHAEEHFTYVTQTSPESDMGRESTAFLEKIREREAQRYEVYGIAGFQYDSNVILAPNNSADATQAASDLSVSGQADGRAIFAVGGLVVPWRSDEIEMSLGYDFYQSLHFQLTNFNLQDHGLILQIAGRAGGVRYGLVGRYDYDFLDGGSFLQEASALPWLSVPAGAFGHSELYYRMRRRDFKDIDFVVRDGFNHAIGIRQIIPLNSLDRYIILGYQFDRDEPVIAGSRYFGTLTPQMFADDARAFGYDGQEVRGGVGWLLPNDISSEAVFVYRHERYKPESEGRIDKEQQITVEFRRPISDHFVVSLAYFRDFNNSSGGPPDSSQKLDFDRHIVSLSLEARY